METYHGHVKTPADAIILFEACRIGLLPRVQRRLSEKERQQIKSGSVFVWDEREAGMRRWTDGKSWSASRVSGSFLTYREMEGKRGGNGLTPPAQSRNRASAKASDGSKTGESDEDGPDGYRYKPDGLMKQSFSITTQNGQHLHLISYYARSSPTANELQQPSNDPNLRHIRPPKNMYPESSVNESTNVPPVTRGPMTGSPYTSAQIPSPYSRPAYPAAYPPTSYPPTSWPPTPSATPPYVYAAYYPHGPPPPGHPHSPPHYAYTPYPPPGYPPYPHPPTTYDRAPAPMTTSSLPPPPHLANGPHLPPSGTAPQYAANPSPRAAQAAQLGPQSQPYSHAPTTSGFTNGYTATQASALQASEPPLGPTLPAPNVRTSSPAVSSEKQPSPKIADAKPPTADSLPPLSEPNPPSQNSEASTAARTVPSLGALLNAQPSDPIPDSRSDRSGSRPGSRSPGNSVAPRSAPDYTRDKLPPVSGAPSADQAALRRLDSAFIHVS